MNATAIAISSYRIEYNGRMLLKAEFPAARAASEPIARVISAASTVILGKENQVRLALACLLARGHLLIEDLPGVGKTTLAHVLARTLGMHFQRIQFTSDMLPADIIGVSIYERDSGSFKFHPGPIFSQVILADEVNRSTPKTQSALLEAMEEHQVTAEGETRKLPEPFFVIATQNPSEQVGTFPLPESQLDRFMMRIELGYPDRDAERALLTGTDRRDLLATLDPCMTPAELMELQAGVQKVHVSSALLDYVQAIVEHTRRSPDYVVGLSPRAALALVHSARAWALLEGRDKVIPEDVQAILAGVAAHRLRPAHDSARRVDVGAQLLAAVPIP
jgi:MoxR-like ATPase